MDKTQNQKQKIQALKERLLEKLNTKSSLSLDDLRSEFPSNELNPAMRALAREKKAGVWRRFLKKADGEAFKFDAGRVKQFGPGKFVFYGDSGQEAYISSKAAKTVLDGDRVSCFLVTAKDGGSVEALPSELIARPKPQVWARASAKADGSLAWCMEGRAETVDIEMDPAPAGSKAGDLWRVEISERGLLRSSAKAAPLERLGNQADKGIESEYAYVSRFGDRGALPECPVSLADAVDKRERVDARALPLVTIDGESTKDFDDAVWAAQKPDGSFELSVHIADVSAFVPEGSVLDQYAQQQMTSVYMPHFVKPMFPEQLSNGMCSLKPNEDRYSLACVMAISAEGEVLSSRFERALMRSAARLTYEQAQEVFDGASLDLPAGVVESLTAMSAVAKALRDRGFAQGRFDMGEDESGWSLNEDGKIEGMYSKPRIWSQKVIEECMLAANKAGAGVMGSKLPAGLFRNHWGMTESDSESFMVVAKALGLSESELPDRFELIKILEEAKGAGRYGQMRSELLSRLSSAQYSSNNQGHYSLAAEEYCHFTSPIRRYPDLICHRLIKSVIDGVEPEHSVDGLKELAEKSTDLSGRSSQGENEARKLLVCEFLSRQTPLETAGRIVSCGERGGWISCQIAGGSMDVFCPSKTLKTAGWVWSTEAGQWSDEAGQPVSEGKTLPIKIDSVSMASRRIEASPASAPLARPSAAL